MNACSYAITRTQDDRVVRIFTAEKDALDYIKYDPHRHYRIERVFYQAYADHPQVFLVAFVDRDDDPTWSFQELMARGKLKRVRKVKDSPRAIREYAFGTSKQRYEEYQLRQLEARVLKQSLITLRTEL